MWEWLFEFIEPLEQADIPYSIVGSVASSVYGEPRATNDLDLVIQVGTGDVDRLHSAFSADRFYVPPKEVIRTELGRGNGAHLNVISEMSMTKADLYPLPSSQASWFVRRRRETIDGRALWFAAPEVVALNKLLFYREGGGERHVRDIRAMLATGVITPTDRAWLVAEVERLRLGPEWALVAGPGRS